MKLNREVLNAYAQIILHEACALHHPGHKWEECPNKNRYLRVAYKHQHKLKSNGLAIGLWINESKYRIVEK